MANIIRILLIAFFLVTSVNADAISAKDAETEVHETINQIKSIVATSKGKVSDTELDKKIESVLLPKFDFDQMSKSSLGAGWKKATPEQQQEFVKLFTSLLSRSYLEKIRKNVEQSEVTYSPSTVKEDRVVVHSRITSDGQTIMVDYRIYKKDGAYKVYDVLVENIGLVSNYRSEFSGILDSGDFESLLKKLREQVSKVNSKA